MGGGVMVKMVAKHSLGVRLARAVTYECVGTRKRAMTRAREGENSLGSVCAYGRDRVQDRSKCRDRCSPVGLHRQNVRYREAYICNYVFIRR